MSNYISYSFGDEPITVWSLKGATIPTWAKDVKNVEIKLNRFNLPIHPIDNIFSIDTLDTIDTYITIRNAYDAIVAAGQVDNLLFLLYTP